MIGHFVFICGNDDLFDRKILIWYMFYEKTLSVNKKIIIISSKISYDSVNQNIPLGKKKKS